MDEETRTSHWNDVFARTQGQGVSWFQDDPRTSWETVLGVMPNLQAAVIDVGGGASALVDRLLDAGASDVSVLDIAAEGLDTARRRLGEREAGVTWMVADVLGWEPPKRYAVWHDRAVLHFLTRPEDQHRYASLVADALEAGGHAVIATFGPDGPTSCSGLPVQRYAAADLSALFERSFDPVDAWTEWHQTPIGAEQQFTWAVLRRQAQS